MEEEYKQLGKKKEENNKLSVTNKQGKKIKILIAIILILVIGIGGFFGYKLLSNGLQEKGRYIVLNQIISIVEQCQALPIPVGNQTVTLFAAECLPPEVIELMQGGQQ